MTESRRAQTEKVAVDSFVMLGDRISRIDKEVGQLSAALEHNERTNKANFDALFAAIGDIRKAVSSSSDSRWMWAPMASWAGVILVVVGMWTQPTRDGLGDAKAVANGLRESLSAERVSSIGEFRILDNLISEHTARLAVLDSKVGEGARYTMEHHDSTTRPELDRLADQVENLRERVGKAEVHADYFQEHRKEANHPHGVLSEVRRIEGAVMSKQRESQDEH